MLAVVGVKFDCLTGRFAETTLGALDDTVVTDAIAASQIPVGISGGKLLMGSVNAGQLAPGSVSVDHLQADSVTADKINANELTAGKIVAAIAEITNAVINHAQIGDAEIDYANIADLHATIANLAKAQVGELTVTNATIENANIDWAQITNLVATAAAIAKAQINQANIQDANIDWAQITTLQAGVLSAINARLGTADINYAQIKDAVLGSAIITEGVGGQLYISRLAVTEANMVSLTTGELIVKGSDDNFYKLTVDGQGNVVTQLTQVTGDNIADRTLNASEKLIEGSITAGLLNVQQIFADTALVKAIKAANIDVADLFANNAYIAALRTNIINSDIGAALNISSNEAIRLKADKTTTDGLRTDLTAAQQLIAPDKIVSTVTGSAQYAAGLAGKVDASAYSADKAALELADVTVGAAAPAGPQAGKLWVDTSGAAPQFKRFSDGAWQIVTDLSKADQAALTALTTRVTSAETSITQTQNAIALKADKTTTDGLNTRLTTAEQQITPEKIVSTVKSGLIIGGANLIASSAARTLAAGSNVNNYWTVYTGLKQGQPYTLSIDSIVRNAGTATAVTLRYYDITSSPNSMGAELGTMDVGGGRQSITFTPRVLAGATWSLLIYAGITQQTTNNTITFNGVQLELGNVATAWSPAPEDQASAAALTALTGRVTSAETSITQTQNSITSKADKTVTDGLNTRLASAEQLIAPDKIVSTVTGSAQYAAALAAKSDKKLPDTRSDNQPPSWYWTNYPQQVVTEFKFRGTVGAPGAETYGALTTVVPWINNTGGAIVQTFRSRDNTYERKSASDTAWGAWTNKTDQAVTDALTARVTTAETSITQTKTDIALKADKTTTDGLNTRLTSAETKITDAAIVNTVKSGLTIGGANLAKNGDFSDGSKNWLLTNGWAVGTPGTTYDKTALAYVESAALGATRQVNQTVGIIAGKTYTLSAMCRYANIVLGPTNPFVRCLYIAWQDANHAYLSEAADAQVTGTSAGFPQRVLTATAPAGAYFAQIGVLMRDATGTMWIDDVMFQEGDVPTAFSPAPEDPVSALKTTSTTLDETGFRVNQTLGGSATPTYFLASPQKFGLYNTADNTAFAEAGVENGAGYLAVNRLRDTKNSLIDISMGKRSNPLDGGADVDGLLFTAYGKELGMLCSDPLKLTGVTSGRMILWANDGADIVTRAAGAPNQLTDISGDGRMIDLRAVYQSVDLHLQIDPYNNRIQTTKAITTASDRNLKRDVEDARSGLIDRLRPRQFKWKAGPDRLNYGFIAQEVDEAARALGLPDLELVSAGPDGMMGVAYEQLIALLVDKAQKQQRQIDALDARIAKLSGKTQHQIDKLDAHFVEMEGKLMMR